ncbi:phosphonoacetaldehyde hydrolase [Oceanobacillus locisalsi]|uniref:Phosphonoacetaldehyde hydrolase n=1 Tax=Oceanobacillus locisalsi TaxID=546107 RepID=A0ABW3NCT8_9BACI
MKKIEGIILDWAGTTVDFGSFAPVHAFVTVFKNAGIEVTIDEAREPMGLTKIDHVRAILSMPRISTLWKERYGQEFTEHDVESLYAGFESALLETLAIYTDPKPEVLETIEKFREQNLKIGSTSGYTQKMMDIVAPEAAKKGYQPDFYITADGTSGMGRPYPYMVYHNMEALKLSAARHVVKVGDTIPDIEEALHAGVWAVAVVIGSSEMGLSEEEFHALSDVEQEERIVKVEKTFIEHGADFTIRSFRELFEVLEEIDREL